uniref:Uncharacterized protein n=1 Tax=Oryza barthii TaxID=65489 RepID=A0A0D3GTH0_9ORYZ
METDDMELAGSDSGCWWLQAATADGLRRWPWRPALSCCLTPQEWLPGESHVLAPLSPDGRQQRRTDNDGSFPLLRALSCCLTPQEWLPGESHVLAPLSPDGRQQRFFRRFSS